MNAVEIADAVTQLAEKQFDPAEFPFEFLAAFGNKETTIARLRKGDSNSSDVPNGILQKNNIHIAVCLPGQVGETLGKLRESPKSASAKAKFILATDGFTLEAEELKTGETIASEYPSFADHFGFFLPLAGISTVREIKENPIDVRATGRLNKLYVELLKANDDWQSEAKRTDLNHFFARLIFCFFAEDTHIFNGDGLFTKTVQQMTSADGGNVDGVLRKLFEAMNLSPSARKEEDLPGWADQFPYVNGGLFSDDLQIPRFTRTARSYLLRAGELNWRQINPDIFGSMIQAVADDEERGALGMHYTSVPNILKVLNPLFLDDLREQLEKAGDHKASLLTLRERMSRIRVFDPACGSGNFLVIAYKEMRQIEAEINRRRGEPGLPSKIPPTNFRGIELRDFAAEIARLALVIAEYQCDVIHRGERLALAEFLPLNKENWIWKGNALHLDWATVCPPTGAGVKVRADDLFGSELKQTEIDFANAGGETYICGNPPYSGLSSQTDLQKSDLGALFEGATSYWKSFDYVMAWFWKARNYMELDANTRTAFVSTNSICQGQLVPMFWPMVLKKLCINFAHASFKWTNLASDNAGVTVAIIGLARRPSKEASLFTQSAGGDTTRTSVQNINAYLVPFQDVYVTAMSDPRSDVFQMYWGNKPTDGGHLVMSLDEARDARKLEPNIARFFRKYFGSEEFIKNAPRACIWIDVQEASGAEASPFLRDRICKVRAFRLNSKAKETRPSAAYAFRFRQIQGSPGRRSIIVPVHSSEKRDYLPVGLLEEGCIVSNAAFALYDAPLWNLALIASKLHLVWIATVCGKLKTDYRYSNTLGWNTFPVPALSEGQKSELTRNAEDILLAREAHFPDTIADLYAPDAMPDDLKRAHERNDETLERIYIGRRFRNDTERLEKLFEMYTAMTAKGAKTEPEARA